MLRPALLLLAAAFSACQAAHTNESTGAGVPPATPSALRAAVERSLPLLQRSMEIWIQEQACISCHHQGLGTMAVSVARERGFAVDEDLSRDQVERMLALLPGGALHGDAGINGTFGRGYQLLALAAERTPRDARTDAMAHYLAGNEVRSDAGVAARARASAWSSSSYRPPLEASSMTATAIAIRALDLYRPDARAAETDATIARARRWLVAREPRDAEDRAMRLFGLAWSGAPREEIDRAARDVLREQRPDGGWAQLSMMESDAYATGQALVALQQAGGLSVRSSEYERGIAYLLERQLADGSWLVETRRRAPGLPYFETGFPHGRHQFISAAATAWSTMALCFALDPAPSVAFGSPRPSRRAEEIEIGLAEIHLAAAFGTREDLRRALDAGGDPDALGVDDLRPLHLAVRDAELVELLLERGAQVDPRTTRGATPLVLAAWYGGEESAAERLLDHGADPLARTHDGLTPLLRAVENGKLALVDRLLVAGADLDAAAEGGMTALHTAVTVGDLEMARRLLVAGAQVDPRCEGSTPLHWASQDGKADIVRLLVEHGADLDARDDEGMTPLAWAAKFEHADTRALEALLDAGADAALVSTSGRTPLQWAEYFENTAVIRALTQRGISK